MKQDPPVGICEECGKILFLSEVTIDEDFPHTIRCKTHKTELLRSGLIVLPSKEVKP